MQKLSIFSLQKFFFILASLKKKRQSINNPISLALIIVDFKIVLKEFLGSSNLSRAQTLCIHELTKVVMVHEHENFVLTTFKVVLPGLESLKNGQKFSIVDLISNFSQNHLSRKISYWILFANIQNQLAQNIIYCIIGNIGLNLNIVL